jgi:hypothetical protein
MEYGLGYLKDPEDKRDILLGNYLIPQTLPKSIDWDDWNIPVKDQGQTQSCVGQSSTGMKEIQETIELNQVLQLDGLAFYNECKKVDGAPNEEGTYIRVAMKILQDQGAFGYKIASYTRLNNVNEMRTALASSGPFVSGFPVYDSFKSPTKGIIDLPKEGETLYGGHAILITGYDDNQKLFKFKNSWSKGWGVRGYAFLTYTFVEKFAEDAWAAVDAQNEVAATFIDMDRLAKDIDQAKNGDKK